MGRSGLARSIQKHWCTADSAECNRWRAGSGNPPRDHHRAEEPVWGRAKHTVVIWKKWMRKFTKQEEHSPAFSWTDNWHGVVDLILYHGNIVLWKKTDGYVSTISQCSRFWTKCIIFLLTVNKFVDNLIHKSVIMRAWHLSFHCTLCFLSTDEWFIILSVSTPSRGTTTIPKSPTITSIWMNILWVLIIW